MSMSFSKSIPLLIVSDVTPVSTGLNSFFPLCADMSNAARTVAASKNIGKRLNVHDSIPDVRHIDAEPELRRRRQEPVLQNALKHIV